MNTLFVKTESKKYPIHCEDDFSNLAEAFRKIKTEKAKVCIITDDNVAKIYLQEVKEILATNFDEVYEFIFEHGEKNKTLETIQEMYTACASFKLDRKSVIVALGGGVTGDMAGFVASTYMRGIRYIQLPTSLLAQVDSSVGGKTGIDFGMHKNMIGSFYQPEFVYINIKTLKTLPSKEFSCGMAEIIKHGCINDEYYLNYIYQNKNEIKNLVLETLKNIVLGSCKIKAEIVSADEREDGIREILNFGHTFAHAIESLSNFSLAHGEAVSIGIAMALRLSQKNGAVSNKDIEKVTGILEFFNLPTQYKEEVEPSKIYEQMHLDKKTKNNQITFIVLTRIGEAFQNNQIQESDILDALTRL